MTAIAPEETRSSLRPALSHQSLAFLNRKRTIPGLLVVCAVFSGTVGTFVLYGSLPNLPVFVLCFTIMGGLQHHLSIIHHEAVHYTLFPSHTLNEWVGRLAGCSIGFTMKYRQTHLRHHAQLGDPDDPDLENYVHYPGNWRYLIKDLLKNLSGLSALDQFVSQSFAAKKAEGVDASFDRELTGVLLVNILMLALLAWAGHWTTYFLLWALPLATITKSLAHFRNVAEHVLLPDDNNIPDLERFRTFTSSAIERFFFSPLNFNYHAEHHLFMRIPFYNLPETHALLANTESYRQSIDVRCSYVHLLFVELVNRDST